MFLNEMAARPKTAKALMQAERSVLVLVDFQARLMPAIADGAAVIANAQKLLAAADLLGVRVVVTEQNPVGIGATVDALGVAQRTVIAKQTFGACATPAFVEAIGKAPDVILAGCEAHVCVTQTVMGLLELGKRVFLVRDATGARTAESKETAIGRMAMRGVEIVTTEMVVFEWLQHSDHPQFKAALALIK